MGGDEPLAPRKEITMAKKAELLQQAQEMGLEVNEKNTIAEIEAAMKSISSKENPEAPEEATEAPETEEKVAKAGKRSAKSLREAEEAAEKEERKAKIAAGELDPSTDSDGETEVKKGPTPITRPRIERRSKNYRASAEKIDKSKEYSLKEAVDLVQKTSTVKFDATVELHVNLNVDPKQADQNIRGSIVLPHGTGKNVKVAVFAPADMHKGAKDAGADIVGEDAILDNLKKEIIDFDVLIAPPQHMAKLGQFARILGPRGLMPNPKSGTVTKDIAKAVKEAKAGRVEYRVDEQGIVHLGVGKVGFKIEDLVENITLVMDAISSSKPSSIKGAFIEKISLTSSMGPSVRVTQN